MTDSQSSHAQEFIRLAYQAADQQTRASRQFAVQASGLAPQLEDPWLILAAISEPQAAVGYLRRALEINPASARARKGMQWAVQRLRTMPVAPVIPAAEAPVVGPTAPVAIRPTPVPAATPATQTIAKPARRAWVSWVVGLLAVVILAAPWTPVKSATHRPNDSTATPSPCPRRT